MGRQPPSCERSISAFEIQVRLDGYKASTKTVEVRSDGMVVPFPLDPVVSMVPVFVMGPTGARLVIDGAEAGTLPKQATFDAAPTPSTFEDGWRRVRTVNQTIDGSGGRVTVDLN